MLGLSKEEFERLKVLQLEYNIRYTKIIEKLDLEIMNKNEADFHMKKDKQCS